MKILIMGLPGSGKTTLAKELKEQLKDCAWINADDLRKQYNDWDFSRKGRIRQAERMRDLADARSTKYVICDFVCPLPEMREIFDADFVIWVDTITASEYEDTNSIFQIPSKYDYRVNLKEAKILAPFIAKAIEERPGSL
jgi:adenylylsulfate kinase